MCSLASELMSRDSGTEARSTEKEELAKDVAAVTYGGESEIPVYRAAERLTSMCWVSRRRYRK